MKLCPTCQSTYTNDGLRFCLQDGAPLIDVVDELVPFEDEAAAAGEDTLQVSGAGPLPTDPIDGRGSPTVKMTDTPQTSLNRPRWRRRSTRDQMLDTDSPPRPFNIGLAVGITAIVVLLLVIVGIGIALLFRGPSGRNRNAQTAGEGGVDVNGPGDNSNAGRGGGRRPEMMGDYTPAAARVEARILRGAAVSENDVAGLSRAELRRLRNTVYARHGRVFDRTELQQFFDGRPWYKRNPGYTDDDLTATDKDNISIIRIAEDRSA